MGTGCVLQSFGDADGDRFDAYRWYRQQEAGLADDRFPLREHLTSETRRLIETGTCDVESLRALTAFGYVRNGHPAVPIYRVQDAPVIDAMAEMVRSCLLEDVATMLVRGVPDITPVRHGVSAKETANELYHLLFGRLNEALVRKAMVAEPPYRVGEGRYLQSVMLT